MEPLTAILVMAGRYGVKELVGALSGQPELGGLASELLGALSGSESRLGSRLAGIEERLAGIEHRLDRVLEQRYEAGIGSGLRCLVDAAGASDGRSRKDDLKQARQQFRQAVAAASSSLQRAIAERYLVLCALALGRQDAARTAWGQLNSEMTAAALEVAQGLFDSTRAAIGRGKPRSAGQGWVKRHERQQLLDDELKQIRRGAADAAEIVQRLFAEAGVIGEAFGHAPPSRIRPVISSSLYGTKEVEAASMTWVVDHEAPGPVRIGALTVTWLQFELMPVRPHRQSPLDPSPFARWSTPASTGWVPAHPSHVVDVRLRLRVEANPTLPRGVGVTVQTPGPHSGVRSPQFAGAANNPPLPANYHRWPPTSILSAGARSCVTSGTLSLDADVAGKLREAVEAHVGSFLVTRSNPESPRAPLLTKDRRRAEDRMRRRGQGPWPRLAEGGLAG